MSKHKLHCTTEAFKLLSYQLLGSEIHLKEGEKYQFFQLHVSLLSHLTEGKLVWKLSLSRKPVCR